MGELSEIAHVKDLLEDFDIIVAYFGVLLPVGVDQALDPIEDRVDRFEGLAQAMARLRPLPHDPLPVARHDGVMF
ncbi:MAG: hypothetical protein ACLQFI_23010 [Methylocella sp.]